MKELKVGCYIRTDKGYIAKIKQIQDDNYIYCDNVIKKQFCDSYEQCYADTINVVKVSENIIDLIYPGDYVNGMEVIAKDSDNRLYVPNNLGEPYDREFYNGCFEYTLLEVENFKIKNIVTKEQFESIKYEVE